MITLAPTRLHWINDDGIDDPEDLCAHSPVHFEIDGDSIVSPDDGDVAVSAAAIFLLRTLERDHTEDDPVGDQLFPCCGHAMYDTGEDDVVICGCPNGIDLNVSHDGKSIQVSAAEGRKYSVPSDDWRQAVMQFSNTVRQFYDDSLEKKPFDDEQAAGYAKMLSEWNRRSLSANSNEP